MSSKADVAQAGASAVTSDAEDEFDDQPVSGVERVLPWVLIIGGLIGAFSAIMLTIEKFESIANPAFVPSCDINPLVACSSVMNSPQGAAFGFPNPIIGIFAFAVVVTIGVAMLGGAAFPEWFWMGFLGGTIFGLAFIHWLAFESVFRIGKLCPYCMAVWIVTITIFSYTAQFLLADEYFGAPSWLRRPAKALSRFHFALPLAWILVFAVVITIHFSVVGVSAVS